MQACRPHATAAIGGAGYRRIGLPKSGGDLARERFGEAVNRPETTPCRGYRGTRVCAGWLAWH